MDEPAIGVTGLSVAPVLAPGLPVIAALRAEPAFRGRIVGLSYDPLDAPNYDRDLLDRVVLIPYPAQGAEHLFDRLRHAHERQPLAALIPTLDAELPLYIKLAPRLAELGIATLLPDRELFELRGKLRLSELAEKTGLRVPRTEAAHNFESVLLRAREFEYPFLLKGHRHGAQLVRAPEQLAAAAELAAGTMGYPLVLQEFVEGVEYDVAALGGRDGRLLGAVPMKKLQLDDRGKAWGGITVDDPELLRWARRLLEGIRWPGPLELEILRDPGGALYLIEVNPRFPAWIHLAVAAGQNLPWALLRLLLGATVEPFPGYLVGAMMLRRCVDVTCALGVYESLVMTGEVDHRALAPDLIRPRFVRTGAAAEDDR